MLTTKLTLIALLLGLSMARSFAADAQQAPVAERPELETSPSIERVWALEESYWRYVQAGDVESYRTLWNDRFVGWPCSSEHPMTKSSIGGWVQEIRDQHIRFTYSLTRERAVDFGDVVIVYYSTPMISKYPDGRVETEVMDKLVHTWLRVGGAWTIIGGMCAPQKPV